MKWIIVVIVNTDNLQRRYDLYRNPVQEVIEFTDLDEAYRVKGTISNPSVIVPITKPEFKIDKYAW